jgi:hypothetical protein
MVPTMHEQKMLQHGAMERPVERLKAHEQRPERASF